MNKIDLIVMKNCQEHNELAVRLINNNKEFLYKDDCVTIKSHQDFLSSYERQGEYLWVIQNNKIPCGMVSVYHIDDTSKKCEWGRFIIDNAQRGIGRIVECMILEWVFYEKFMNKLYCEVLINNNKVINLHYSFGFKLEGIYSDHVFKNGKFINAVTIAIKKEEWKIKRNNVLKNYSHLFGNIFT